MEWEKVDIDGEGLLVCDAFLRGRRHLLLFLSSLFISLLFPVFLILNQCSKDLWFDYFGLRICLHPQVSAWLKSFPHHNFSQKENFNEI